MLYFLCLKRLYLFFEDYVNSIKIKTDIEVVTETEFSMSQKMTEIINKDPDYIFVLLTVRDMSIYRMEWFNKNRIFILNTEQLTRKSELKKIERYVEMGYKTIDYSKILESTATNITDRIHLYYILNNDILKDVDKQAIVSDFKEANLKNEISFLDWLSKTKPTPNSSEKKLKSFNSNDLALDDLKAKKHDDIKIKKKDYMTETLADLYITQGKYHEALKAYKILCLKYPEKISLFADQIKFIKKQIKNQ